MFRIISIIFFTVMVQSLWIFVFYYCPYWFSMQICVKEKHRCENGNYRQRGKKKSYTSATI